ncbi:MAG: hypothetical protein IJW28_01430, partial [Clostridia bacterium]|nr:hypothetical protein [Clostridia bacterium]
MKRKILGLLMSLCMVTMLFTGCGHSHILIKVDEVAATCTTKGNTLYYKCDCGKYFSDAEAKTEILKDSWVIDETGHSYASGWTYDDTHHWKEATCSHSTEKGQYSEHNLSDGECFCGYGAIVYTVTEEEWKTNLRLTKSQGQP